MAIKNSKQQEIKANYNVVMEILRSPKFATLIDATFTEEAKTQNGINCIEFRYVKKTTMLRYGRNFFIVVPQVDEDTTNVTVTTQSRKVTVLLDTQWKSSVDHVFNVLNALL